MRAIRWIVIHSSDTADKQGRPVDADIEQMRRYHVEHNGWRDIGYHYVIRMNGALEYGRPLAQEGAHVGGFNGESIGICVSGDGDLAPFTEAQRAALAHLCAKLCVEFKILPDAVIGHREADDHGAPHVAKTCPGTKVDMEAIRDDVAKQWGKLVMTPKTPPLPGPPRLPSLPAETLEQRLARVEGRLADVESMLFAA